MQELPENPGRWGDREPLGRAQSVTQPLVTRDASGCFIFARGLLVGAVGIEPTTAGL
jgi:hypothetical protein